MPLSQQLKSEMTGFPTEMLPQKEDESHVAESGKMSDFNKSKEHRSKNITQEAKNNKVLKMEDEYLK